MPLLALVLAGSIGMGGELSGSGWRPSLISAFTLPAETHMFVEFKEDGRITGNGGCNYFFGGYTISGNSISIGPLASTRKGCPGLMQMEVQFFATLEAAKSFAREGDKLVLFDAAGIELAEFALADAR